MTFLLRFWPYIAGALLIVAAGWYLHHTGYESGRAASEAHWKPLFDAAKVEYVKAEARADMQEAQSRTLSAKWEAEHAEQVASLTLRADAAQRTNVGLVRQLTAARRCPMPENGGAADKSDDPSRIPELAERVGSDLTSLARRCESDAAKLTILQGWVRDQLALQ